VTLPTAEDSSRLRFSILLIVVGCLFVALISRLYFLDVLDTSNTTTQINASITRVIYTPAPRGEILDREGQALVDNISVPTIEVQRQDSSDVPMVTRLAALLGMTVKDLTSTINNVQYTAFDYVPVYPDASAEQMLYVEEHPADFPGVVTTTLTQPHVTALGEYAANIVGYVGPITGTELAAWKGQGYAPGDIVGQFGAEYEFENELKGTPGKTVIDVNAQGVELSQVSSTPPIPGKNVVLTINGGLQKLAVEELRTQEANARKVTDPVTKIKFESNSGAVVAEDPRNGQLLALATDPSYNPNQFDDGDLSNAAYNRIKKDDGLYDLAVAGEYAPGSTFKLVTATASLKYGIFSPSYVYDDIGYIMIGPTKFEDDDGVGAGPIDLTQAIEVSSDNYFNQIGADLWDGRGTYGDDALQKIAGDYGFNKPTGIDLPGEVDSFNYVKVNGKEVDTQIPTPEIDAALHADNPKDFPYASWYTGVSAHMAIGQQLTVTPLQLANAYSAFANGGTLYAPRVALEAQTSSGKVVKRYHSTITGHSPALSSEDRSAMLAGFIGVVNNSSGTANVIFANTPLASEDIAGKTGTAQVTGTHTVDGVSMPQQDSSVFTSFAPADNPQYVIDCFMPDAGYGADAAAPVVRSLYDYVFAKPIQAPTYLNPSATSGLQN
jgi:penicillin-binding protein 2